MKQARQLTTRNLVYVLNRVFVLGLQLCFLPGLSGCIGSSSAEGTSELTWGRRGISDGRLQKPRAIAIDDQDRLFIVDMTGRIQVFDRNGEFSHSWSTPAIENGKPSGLSIDLDGNVLVADTHYYRLLVYTPEGKMLKEKTIGGTHGNQPGEFGFVTDVVQDSKGNYYIAEYGEYDRIQKFSPEGEFILQWGSHGDEIGQFIRPQNLEIDDQDHLWVVDACNHRVQVFDATGEQAELVRSWGVHGREPGQLNYPYDLTLDDDGHVYICEFGNHRVQKFKTDGTVLRSWGTNGRRDGEVNQPWGLVIDSKNRIHLLDTGNHRVHRIRM